jgi:peptidyl-prolyl cis-trans isomerase C
MTRTGMVAAALVGLLLPHAPQAQGTPPATPSSGLELPPRPADLMAAMAHQLDGNPDLVVVSVQDVKITQAEMADVIRTMPASMASLGFEAVSQRALDVLVTQKVMMLNAVKQGLDKDPAVIREIAILRARALADAWLSRQGNATISDAALRARYDRDIAGKPGPIEVRARVVVVPTEDEARMVIDRAASGTDFASLAKSYSKDGTAARGGDMGYATLEAVTPEIGYAMFSLGPGQTSPFPMKSAGGYYFVLHAEGRRQRSTPTFEEARPGLEKLLRAEAVQTAIRSAMAQIVVTRAPKQAEQTKK